jgi:predicted small lipoprotein YifL
MRQVLSSAAAVLAAMALSACGEAEPHPYPADTRAAFDRECPPDNPVCVCTWDGLTRALPYEDYQEAMETFRADGLMDPRVTRVRTKCREKHAG